MGCSRCGADTRLIPAHWNDKRYCPACCLELDSAGRIPATTVAPAPPTVAGVVTLLGATVVPTGDNPYGLNNDTHRWARCDTCGQGSMVKRATTPLCRMTPHCKGKHR
jgi:hypothetical protein